MPGSIASIVEGHSEVESVPVLLRRILNDLEKHTIKATRPIRVSRYKLVKDGELEKALNMVVRKRENVAAILVLLDADDDCPKELGPKLLERGRKTTDRPIAVTLAKSEFEAWFLGAKESLREVRGIKDSAIAPENPESIKGAKEMLTENMEGSRSYNEVDDQPALAEEFNMNDTRKKCPSFDKFYRDVINLISMIEKE